MPLQNAQDYPLWINAGLFLVAAVAVWFAGTRLTRTLDAIAERTGLGQAFVGMLLLGGITSLPEIANTLNASAIGNPALAVNNLLGSAAINILLLAVADAIVGRNAVTAIVAEPATLMMSALCILVLTGIGLAITATDVAVFGIGLWSLLLSATTIGAFWLASGYDKRAPWRLKRAPDEPDADREEKDAAESEARHSLRGLVIRSAIAGVVIFVAGYTLSQTGDALAKQTGLGSGMVGFALIGISTSMPELSSVLTALRLGRYEMAFAQVLGTNFINLSLILLADAVYTEGPVINELGRFETVSALLGAMLIAVFLVGLLERRNPAVIKMGWDSLAVMVIFGGGLVVLYFIG